MGSSTSKDVAVGFVLFNPTRSKRLTMNYLYIKNIMKKKNIPIFTLELIFEGQAPEIPESKNVFHVEGNSFMFHKERMCRILEEKIPPQFSKIMFCDADVIFQRKDWYEQLSKLLDTYDVVHPFSVAVWKDLTYTKDITVRKSSLLSNSHSWEYNHHPGFAWAFRREWYKKVGFFDWSITGSGDTLSCAAWLNKPLPNNSGSSPKKAILSKYETFVELVKEYPPKITYMDGIVEHLWHGSRQNRKYAERHNMLNNIKNIDDIITINKDGIFEFRDLTLNIPFLKY